MHAVGDDPVAPTVEAARGPGGGLGDGDANVQAVHPAPPAEYNGGDAVAQPVLRVGMEGAHERHLCTAQRVPADDRRDRLVEVGDVVAPAAQLLAQAHHGEPAGGDVRDGAVCGDADRAPERHEALGRRQPLGARAAMQARGRGVIGVKGREDMGLVPRRPQLGREGLDVTRDTARVGPRVRRDEGDPHGLTLPSARGAPIPRDRSPAHRTEYALGLAAT